jgi:hypothetical protein
MTHYAQTALALLCVAALANMAAVSYILLVAGPREVPGVILLVFAQWAILGLCNGRCDTCHGCGHSHSAASPPNPCPACKGTGSVWRP